MSHGTQEVIVCILGAIGFLVCVCIILAAQIDARSGQ